MTTLVTKSTFYHPISTRNGLPKKYIKNYAKLVTARPTLACHKEFGNTVVGGSWSGHKKAYALTVRQIRCMLDDIVQCEYPKCDGAFFDLYYPSGANECAVEPLVALRSLIALFELCGTLGEGYDPRYKRIAEVAGNILKRGAA
jgi:hypothetical protein